MLRDDFSELEEQRLNKLEKLREQGIEPYPTRSQKSHSNAAAISAFDKAEAEGETEVVEVVLAGRLARYSAYGQVEFCSY
jgi:lysyl-tRNA synthetase class 2